MDVIRKMAVNFSLSGFREYGTSLEKINSELSSKLLYINKTGEKLRFLAYLKDIAEKEYQNHAPKCKNPNSCGTNEYLENCLYAIQQEYDDYYEISGGISTVEKPAMQFFEKGQYFDAYTSIREIIGKAKKSIVIVDGYVSEKTLVMLPSKAPNISLNILTSQKCKSPEFDRAIELFNKQYSNLNVYYSKDYHDRFLVIDNSEFYHFGASLKDAGNQVFMFSEIQDKEITDLIIKRLQEELK
jgi:hypothetical protein